MTDNLPAVPEPRPSAEVATQDVDSWTKVMAPLVELANRIYDTEFVPGGIRGSSPATTAAMLYGREVGLPPMTSLNMLHVVDGKPGLSAEGMRSLVFAAGHEIEFVEMTTATCRMRGRRRGGDRWTELEWTIDMARTAGIANRGHNWKNYPRAMLAARCTTELCRMIFPDVIHGFRSVEELDDMAGADGAEGGAPAAATSKVSRRRTKRTPVGGDRSGAGDAAAVEQTSSPPTGPPLPGEPGYEDDSPPGPAGIGPGRGVPDTAGEGVDTEDPTPREADRTGEESAPSPVIEAGGPGDDSTPDPGSPDPTGPETHAEEPSGHQHPTGPRKPSRAQMRMLWGTLGGFGLTLDEEREERLLVATTILGREVETFGEPDDPALSADEVTTLIDALAMVTPANDRAALNNLLDQYDAAKAAQADQDETDEAAAGDDA